MRGITVAAIGIAPTKEVGQLRYVRSERTHSFGCRSERICPQIYLVLHERGSEVILLDTLLK